MASMGSFPLLESSVTLHSGNHIRLKIPPLGYRLRKGVELGGLSDSAFGCSSRFFHEDNAARLPIGVGCSKPFVLRKMLVRTAAKGSGEADQDGDDGDEALQATIEKSKKVLAMRRELLQQIAQRRKLVSSIKNGIIDPDGETDDIASTDSDDIDEDHDNDFSFSNTSTLATPNLAESSDVNENVAKEPRKEPPLTRTPSSVHSQKHVNDTTPKTVQSDKLSSSRMKYSSAPSQRTSSNLDFKKKYKNTIPERVTSNPQTSSNVESEKRSTNNLVGTTLSDLSSFLSASSVEPSHPERRDASTDLSLNKADAANQEPTNEDVKPPPLAGVNVMNVILVAAECAPWCKTGGLGDVAGALPKALARRGHRVMVVLPRYGDYTEPQHTGIRKMYKVDGQDMEVTFFQAFIDGVDFVFIDSPLFRHLGNNIYGGNRTDILRRMVLFCKAAVEVPWHVPCGGVCYGDGNLVFIANDWHTALLPVYLKAYYRDNGLMKYTRSVLVIHNIAHQGRGPVDDFSYVDLPPHYLDLFRMYDPMGGEHFNIFAAGLKTADRVVTVSHGYAWELKTSEGGWGLHNIINDSDWKLRGIVNGIDTKEWSPELDVYLKSDGYTNYSLETLQIGKRQCKAALQKELGLPVRDDVPLIGFIGRLDHQKGVDIIAEAIPWMMDQDVQLVMLGTGRPDLEQMLRQFEGQYNDRVRGWVGFSVKTAHRITAGSDILLMPSRFEPCGLNQLYAMRYGTIPVVHAVGGLRDTVQPFDPYNETGLGWTLNTADANQLIHALGNSLLTYRQYKQSWEGIQRRGMMQDLSWDNAAQSYEEVLIAAKYQW